MKKLLLILIILTSLSLNAAAESPTELYYKEMHACKVAEDCVQAPEVFSACFHYCKDAKCDSAHDCPLFNKYYKNFPDCAQNVPCKSNPNGIICQNGVCARKNSEKTNPEKTN